MKVIGLIGGMSWESSAEYYKLINEEVKKRLGGLHSAECILYNLDFGVIERLQREGEWEEVGLILSEVAQSLEKAGAAFIVICTNTAHKVVDIIQSHINIPILHIADATAKAINREKINKVGLLGTQYTMEEDFYQARLQANGVNVILPKTEEREALNKIIFDELCLGKFYPSSKDYYEKVIDGLIARGAEGIILGCTEISLLIKAHDTQVPLFDTTYLHAHAAVTISLNQA